MCVFGGEGEFPSTFHFLKQKTQVLQKHKSLPGTIFGIFHYDTTL